MKRLLPILLLLTACSPYKQTIIYPFIPSYQFPAATDTVTFHQLGYYPADYGLYDDQHLPDLYTRPIEPVTVDWVTAEQIRCGIPVHPFYFATAGLESDSVFWPPFHLTVTCPFLFRADIMESVWLLNENFGLDSTRELDLFESGQGTWGNRLWSANHFGGPDYSNRIMISTEILNPPSGGTVDIFVYKDKAIRYLNGRKISEVKKNLDYEYRVRVTMIILTEKAKEATWRIDNLKIEKL